jgi:hypothetical protein
MTQPLNQMQLKTLQPSVNASIAVNNYTQVYQGKQQKATIQKNAHQLSPDIKRRTAETVV